MSFRTLSQSQIRFYVSIVWLVLTAALTIWWWWHGLEQLEVMQPLMSPEKFQSTRTMLISEGLFFIVTILSGGLSLIVLAKNDYNRHEQVRLFFANFTHDLKTSMSRLRLQSDLLKDDNTLTVAEQKQRLNKLSENLGQLDLQLENSLWVARGDKQAFHFQSLRLSGAVSAVRHEWPDIEISLEKDVAVYTDSLALRSIFRNIIQNAAIHAKAQKIRIQVQEKSAKVILVFSTDGLGFKGDISQLGKKFIQPKSSHGNGLGLYLTRFLIEKLNGQISFKLNEDNNLIIHLELPAAQGRA